ncbi:hypothetical protein AK88_00508 [Plasmodium fragile]|uniref:DNL-type domain-containing protein n=1 Tax=Plasmodium fragile TaxID=5857 RepID=A0A0D9QRS7_PLAFR|nr:uncharacterized protein AK88_00508 [Plasmodium fragile]KJP89800.1 hypothetical protein AK88_00508 [Plasmodium fragile]
MAPGVVQSVGHVLTRFATRRTQIGTRKMSASTLIGYFRPPGGSCENKIKNTCALSTHGREILCGTCRSDNRVSFGKEHFRTLNGGGDKSDDQNACKGEIGEGESGHVSRAATDIVQLNEDGKSVSSDGPHGTTTDVMKTESATEPESDQVKKEYMVLMFTCKICEKKSVKKFSKQAYNNGVVIIRCPSCENLHLISDQLGWFQEGKTNIEDILKQKGENVIRKFSYNNMLEIDDLLNAYK